MITACLNGDRHPREHPRLPVTALALGLDALACVEVGATMVHIHPRDATGRESLWAADVREAVVQVRTHAPGVPVSVTTREGITATVRERLQLVRDWPEPSAGGPDQATVNWHEPGASELARVLLLKGIGVEAGLWTPRAASDFVATNWPWQVERILVEAVPGTSPGVDGRWAAERVIAALGLMPVGLLVHGEGPWTWPVLRWAQDAGYAVRIGLEDTLALPSGREARDNAELVSAALGRVP